MLISLLLSLKFGHEANNPPSWSLLFTTLARLTPRRVLTPRFLALAAAALAATLLLA